MRDDGRTDGISGDAPAAVAPMRRVSALRYGVLDGLLGYALRRAQNALYLDFHTATAAFDISPRRFAALVLIDGNPGVTQSVLADAMGIDRSGALRLVEHLRRRGWVRRARNGADGRVWGLFTTQRGAADLRAMEAIVVGHDHRIAARLGADADDLKRLLERLADG